MTFEPTAAETGPLRLERHAGDGRDARHGDWAFGAIESADPVPVQTAPPLFRFVLLLLMLVVLAGVAFWTPATLQSLAASTMELMLATDIPQARTEPGPRPAGRSARGDLHAVWHRAVRGR